MFKRILLPADGSEHSIRAAEKAITISKGTNEAMVTVLYVVDGNISKADVLKNWDALGIASQRKAKLSAIEQQAKMEKVKYEIKIVRGEPGAAIVKYANDHHYDLIVMGSRGLNVLQEMVLGSVSHKVAKRAHCPVMIVK
ncbi:universal stress protein [Alkalihalobacterium alkalinitrilicum]|uniref:universal stress protein n=1 Tax=Alkalihalobacterium alkalinitrilicum TaxID=427920 RepID=UPI0009952129|nr:universal stress protein [Alkalihalobacterium alkalinitrilicum]